MAAATTAWPEKQGQPPLTRSQSMTDYELPDLHDPTILARLLLDDLNGEVDIKLVRGEFLAELWKSGRTFIRRQNAEEEFCRRDSREDNVFVSRPEIEKWKNNEHYRSKIRIIAFSHVWESKQHPDPTGNQLSALMSAKLWHDQWSWYFIDYMSLLQYPRSMREEVCFKNALTKMHVMYAHDFSFTYILPHVSEADELDADRIVRCWFEDGYKYVKLCQLQKNVNPYDQRGWCEAESQWSRMRSRTDRTFVLGQMSDGIFARAPMDMESFKAQVNGGKLVFTNKDDMPEVMKLQRTVFLQKARTSVTLRLMKLPQLETQVLSKSVQFYTSLQLLSITDSRFQADKVKDFVQAIARLGNLNVLILDRNRIDDEIATELAPVLRYIPHVSLANNFIGKAAMQAMVDALTTPDSCRDLRSQSLNLEKNRICNMGAEILSWSLAAKTCRVVNLNLNCNAIGVEGAQALAHAITKNSSLRILSLEETNICLDGAEALAESIRSKPFLRLDLVNCGVDRKDWWKLLRRFGFRVVRGSPSEAVLQTNTHVFLMLALFLVPAVISRLSGLANMFLLPSDAIALVLALPGFLVTFSLMTGLVVKAYLPMSAAMSSRRSWYRGLCKPALVWPLAVLSIITRRCCAGPWRKLFSSVCVVSGFMMSPVVVAVLTLTETMPRCSVVEAGLCAWEGLACQLCSLLSFVLGIVHGSILLLCVLAFWALPWSDEEDSMTCIHRLKRLRSRIIGFCERYWLDCLQARLLENGSKEWESSDEVHYLAYMIGIADALPLIRLRGSRLEQSL
ncbi:NLRC3 [Symbiodinium sp. CCMP2456]|nr:NLRC3 [Symbiodinium sp. CCMP2456]